MKNINNSGCLLIGKGGVSPQTIGQVLAPEGITALIRQKDSAAQIAADGPDHWSGQPGQDLFFNGWKLLF